MKNNNFKRSRCDNIVTYEITDGEKTSSFQLDVNKGTIKHAGDSLKIKRDPQHDTAIISSIIESGGITPDQYILDDIVGDIYDMLDIHLSEMY